MLQVGLAQHLDSNSNRKAELITWFSGRLTNHYSNKSFGSGLENLHIGFICTSPPPGFEDFSKARKPRFRATEKISNLDGTTAELRNSFSYDVKLDRDQYNLFVNGSDKESLEILSKEIVLSLSNLSKLPKKVKDFDSDAFVESFAQFANQILIEFEG